MIESTSKTANFGIGNHTIGYHDTESRTIGSRDTESHTIGYRDMGSCTFGSRDTESRTTGYFDREECTTGFQVETDSTKCYNGLKNNDRGNNNMSIVGILKCADGKVIAFGDSKSSIGQSEEKRRIAQKVFKFENFVVVTYGDNRIEGNKLEDIINEYPKNLKNFTILFELLSTRHNLFNNTYLFFVYSNDSKYIKSVTVSQNKINIENHDSICMFGGKEKYWRYIQENFKQYFETAKEAKEYFQIELEKLIKHFDNILPYNPCGLPVKIEIF